ncbi:MAG: hypothetical protein AAGA18_11445 [Verrucomicrobiota bacterium]
MSTTKNLDIYFMDARSKLIDIAAFMDRVELKGENDYRFEAFQQALKAIIGESKGARTKKVLEIFSDRTIEPIDQAGMKGAAGAWNPESDGKSK